MKKMMPQVCTLAALLIACLPSSAQQVNPEILKNLDSALNLEEHLSPKQRNVLSPAFQNQLALAHRLLDKGTDDGGDPDAPSQTFSSTQNKTLPALRPRRYAADMPVIEDPHRLLVLGMIGRARLLMF